MTDIPRWAPFPSDPDLPVAFVNWKGETQVGKRLFVPTKDGYQPTPFALFGDRAIYSTLVNPSQNVIFAYVEREALKSEGEIPDERLQEMLARALKARKGPWHLCDVDKYAQEAGVVAEDKQDVASYLHLDDADFVRAAREDVPALVAEVFRLKHELRRATGFSPPAS